jgi:hypothetical protein
MKFGASPTTVRFCDDDTRWLVQLAAATNSRQSDLIRLGVKVLRKVIEKEGLEHIAMIG